MCKPVAAGPAVERWSAMLQEDDATPRQPLEYGRALRATVRLTYFASVGVAVLLTGAVAAWCFVHTIQVMVEAQQVARSRPIDFAPSQLGMPVEKSIPLGVLSGGVALVALVHFLRLWNSRKAARPAA